MKVPVNNGSSSTYPKVASDLFESFGQEKLREKLERVRRWSGKKGNDMPYPLYECHVLDQISIEIKRASVVSIPWLDHSFHHSTPVYCTLRSKLVIRRSLRFCCFGYCLSLSRSI